MPLSTLLPIGGAALGAIASRAISSLSQGLNFREHLSQADGAGAEDTKPATSPRSHFNLKDAVTRFVAQLQQQLESYGVDSSQAVTLKLGPQGAIEVDGDHPERAKIEDLLRQDGDLTAAFRELSATATENRERFAVGNDNRFGEFRLEVRAGEASIRFE